jgi:hypothetical protein
MKRQKQCVCVCVYIGFGIGTKLGSIFLSCFRVRFEKEKKNFHTHRSHLSI